MTPDRDDDRAQDESGDETLDLLVEDRERIASLRGDCESLISNVVDVGSVLSGADARSTRTQLDLALAALANARSALDYAEHYAESEMERYAKRLREPTAHDRAHDFIDDRGVSIDGDDTPVSVLEDALIYAREAAENDDS